MDSDEDLLGEPQEKDDYQELDDLDADEENALLGDSDEEGGNRNQSTEAEQYEFVDEDGNPVEVGENEDVEFIQVAPENSQDQFDETGAEDILDLAVDPDLEFDDSSILFESPDRTDVEHSVSSMDGRQHNQKQVRLKRQPSLPGSSSSSLLNQSHDGSQPIRSIAVTVQQNVTENYTADINEAHVSTVSEHDFHVGRTVAQEQGTNYSRDSDESEDEEESGRGRFRTERTNIIQLSNRRPRTNLPDSLDAVFPYDESDRGNRGGRRQERHPGFSGGRNRGGGGGNHDRMTPRGPNDNRRDRNQGGASERTDDRDRRKERDRSDDHFKLATFTLSSDPNARGDGLVEQPSSQCRQSGEKRTSAIPSLLDNNFERPGSLQNSLRNSEPLGGRKILINPHFKGPVSSEGSDAESSPYGRSAGGPEQPSYGKHPAGQSTGLLASPNIPRRQHPSGMPPHFDQMSGHRPMALFHGDGVSHHGMTEYHRGQVPELSQPPPHLQHMQQQQQQQQLPSVLPSNFGGGAPMFPPPRGRQAPPPPDQSSWPQPGNFIGANKMPPHDLRIPPPMPQFQDSQFSRPPPPQPNFSQLNLSNGPPPPINNRTWDSGMPPSSNRPQPLFPNPPDLRPPGFSGMQQLPPNMMGSEPVLRLVQFSSPPPNFSAPPPVRGQWAEQPAQPLLIGNLAQMTFNRPPPLPHMHQQISQTIPSVSGIKPFPRSERLPEYNLQQSPRVDQADLRNQQWLKAVEDFNKHQANFQKRPAEKPVFTSSPKQMKMMSHSTPKQSNWRTPPNSNSNIKEIVLVDTLPTSSALSSYSAKSATSAPTSRQAVSSVEANKQAVPMEEEDEETRRYREQIELQKQKREQIVREKEHRRQMMAEQRRKNLLQPTPKANEPAPCQVRRPFEAQVSPSQLNQPTWNSTRHLIDTANRDASMGGPSGVPAGVDPGGQRRKVFVRKVHTGAAAQMQSPQPVRSLVELTASSGHRNSDQNQNQRQQQEHSMIARQSVKRMGLQNIEVCVQKTLPSMGRQAGHNNQLNRNEPFLQQQHQQQQQPRGGVGNQYQRPPPPSHPQQHLPIHSSYAMRFPSMGPPQTMRNQQQNAAQRPRIILRSGPRAGQFRSGGGGGGGPPPNNFAELPPPQQQQQQPPTNSPNFNRPLRQLMSVGNNMNNHRQQHQQLTLRDQQQPREFGSIAGPNRVVLMPQDQVSQQQQRPQPVLRMPFLGESPTAIRPQHATQGQRTINSTSNRQGHALRPASSLAGATSQKIVITNRQSLSGGQTASTSKKILVAGKPENIQRKVIVNSQPQLRKIVPPTSSEPSSVVRIENLAVATSDAQIRKICETVGAVENITKDDRTAVVKFKDHVHAKQFMNRYQRRMVDLSLISISLAT